VPERLRPLLVLVALVVFVPLVALVTLVTWVAVACLALVVMAALGLLVSKRTPAAVGPMAQKRVALGSAAPGPGPGL